MTVGNTVDKILPNKDDVMTLGKTVDKMLPKEVDVMTPGKTVDKMFPKEGNESELVITNYNYTDDSGYKWLPSVKEDFKNIVQCLKDELGTTSI